MHSSHFWIQTDSIQNQKSHIHLANRGSRRPAIHRQLLQSWAEPEQALGGSWAEAQQAGWWGWIICLWSPRKRGYGTMRGWHSYLCSFGRVVFSVARNEPWMLFLWKYWEKRPSWGCLQQRWMFLGIAVSPKERDQHTALSCAQNCYQLILSWSGVLKREYIYIHPTFLENPLKTPVESM